MRYFLVRFQIRGFALPARKEPVKAAPKSSRRGGPRVWLWRAARSSGGDRAPDTNCLSTPTPSEKSPTKKPFAKPESVCDSRAPPQAAPTLATDGTSFSRGRRLCVPPGDPRQHVARLYSHHDDCPTAKKSRAFSGFRASVQLPSTDVAKRLFSKI